MAVMNNMIDLFNKVKLAAGTLSNNEDETAPGRMQMREDPPGRETSGLGRPWGEGPLSNEEPPVYSGAVENELRQGRAELLERSFEGMPGMASVDKGLMGALFTSFGDSSTTSHSPLLQKRAHVSPTPTLIEQVKKVLK